MRTIIKLKIGEFSRLMQTTVKTLRHYEQIGLLAPLEVDEDTGYRYYSLGQMQRLNAIKGLETTWLLARRDCRAFRRRHPHSQP